MMLREAKMKKALIGGILAALLAVWLSSCGGDCTGGGGIFVPTGDATLEATVVSATTSNPIAGAEVCLVYLGETTNVCATSLSDGSVRLSNLPAGIQTFHVTAPGYVALDQQVVLVGGSSVSATFALSPNLATGELRIVLSWGSDPEDLDSHLWVPPSGARTDYYEVFYSDEGNCEADPWACLDVDDTDSYGPETVTIRQQLDGTYVYAVHWYDGVGTWAGSDAHVRVYGPSGLIQDFRAPNDTTFGDDSWWYVFDLNNGQITPKNSLSDTPPLPSNASLGAGPGLK